MLKHEIHKKYKTFNLFIYYNNYRGDTTNLQLSFGYNISRITFDNYIQIENDLYIYLACHAINEQTAKWIYSN